MTVGDGKRVADRSEPPVPLAPPGGDSEAASAVRGLFGRDSLYVLLWAAQLGIAALCTPISTRLLGPSGFGTVATAVAVMQLLVALGGISLQTAVQREYERGDGRRGARRLVTAAIIVSATTFAIAFAAGPGWSSALRLGSFGGAMRYAVMWAALTAISNAGLGLLRSSNRLFAFGTVSLLQSVVAEALSLSLVAFVHRTPSEFVLGQLLAQLGAVAVALAATRPLLIRRRDLAMVGNALRYSVALLPALVSSFVLDAVDRLIIRHDLHASDVARYAVARNIGAIPLLLLGVVGSAWLPRLFALARDDLRGDVLAQSRDALFTLIVVALVGLSAGSPLVLYLWVNSRFNPAGLQLIVTTVSVTALPVAAMMVASWALMITNRTLVIGVRTSVAAAANVALNILLVPRLGIEGSALATIAGYALLYALLAHAARRELPIARPAGRLLGLSAAAVGASFALSQAPVGPVALAVRGVLALACVVLFAATLAEIVRPRRYPRLARLALLRRVLGSS